MISKLNSAFSGASMLLRTRNLHLLLCNNQCYERQKYINQTHRNFDGQILHATGTAVAVVCIHCETSENIIIISQHLSSIKRWCSAIVSGLAQGPCYKASSPTRQIPRLHFVPRYDLTLLSSVQKFFFLHQLKDNSPQLSKCYLLCPALF